MATVNEERTMNSVQNISRTLNKMAEVQPTLRDQFAMQFLNGACSNLSSRVSDDFLERTVKQAYEVADLMIKAREQ